MSAKSLRVAARLVSGKPVLRERDGDYVTNQAPLDLGDNDTRARDVGDQTTPKPRQPAVADKVAAIKLRLGQILKGEPTGVEVLNPVGSDNKPPPTAGHDSFPALHMADGMR